MHQEALNKTEPIRTKQNDPSTILWQVMVHLMCYMSGMAAVPADMVLRPSYGSQYINPLTQIGGILLMGAVAALDAVFGSSHFFNGPIGMLFAFLVVLIIGCAHGRRVLLLMLNVDRESDSCVEGAPLGFFHRLPRSSWTTTRMFYEPLAVFCLAVVLFIVGAITPILACYMAFLSSMLFWRAVLVWYGAWVRVRDVIDDKSRASVLMKIMKTGVAPADMSPAIVSRIVDAQQQIAAARIVTGLNPALDALLSPLEPRS